MRLRLKCSKEAILTMHEPYKRIIPGAKRAVLFVHGIVSTPRFFDDFVAIVPEGWSVHNILLPGHGGTVRAFGQHSAKEWTAHVHACLAELRATHEQVYLVGHSLGTLLLIREAVRDDTRIAGMLLLCVPLRIWVKPSALIQNALKGVGLIDSAALRTSYGIEQDGRVWRYGRWIPRYLELFRESAAARREVSQVTVPTIAYMAEKDELVSLRGAKLLTANPAIDVRILPDSRHHEFAPADKAALLNALREMGSFC